MIIITLKSTVNTLLDLKAKSRRPIDSNSSDSSSQVVAVWSQELSRALRFSELLKYKKYTNFPCWPQTGKRAGTDRPHI